MSVVSWPREDDPGCLGEKAQGLLDLAAIGLRTPATLVIRDSAIRGGAALVAVVGAILEFVAALPGPRRAVSLRCAVKHGPDKVAVLPESLLDLGLSDAVLRRAQDGRVCTAHARAFFGFFSEVAPERVERWPLERQLDAALVPLLRHFARPGFDPAVPQTLIVQKMVYGDADPHSLTGMCYTRHPSTGERVEYGHFIMGRQGMALGGVDDPAQRDLAEMRELNPRAHAELLASFAPIERYYRAVRQLEFTAEGETLYLLQNTQGRTDIRLISDA